MRQCQISYKSALFLMNRIRFAMAPDNPEVEKLSGTVEVDEPMLAGSRDIVINTRLDAERKRPRICSRRT